MDRADLEEATSRVSAASPPTSLMTTPDSATWVTRTPATRRCRSASTDETASSDARHGRRKPRRRTNAPSSPSGVLRVASSATASQGTDRARGRAQPCQRGERVSGIWRSARPSAGTLSFSTRHSDVRLHNRSVFTLAAEGHDLLESLLAGIAAMPSTHRSPRGSRCAPRASGRSTLVPVVPFAPESMERAKSAARLVLPESERSCALPVFLYGEVGGGARRVLPAWRSRRARRRVDAGRARPGRTALARSIPGLGPCWLALGTRSSPTTSRADDGRRSDRPGRRGFRPRVEWGCAACRPSGPPPRAPAALRSA